MNWIILVILFFITHDNKIINKNFEIEKRGVNTPLKAYYPLKADLAYPLTTLKRAKIAVIPRATKMIVGNQFTRVVPKLLTNVVNPSVKLAGIDRLQDPIIVV